MSTSPSSENQPELTLQTLQLKYKKAINLLENVDAAMYSIDRDWNLAYVNAECSRVLGAKSDELVGKSLWESFPLLEGTAIGNTFRQAMETGQFFKIEEFYQPSQTWYEVHCNPYAEGLAVYFRDISVRKAFESDLKEKEESLGFLSSAGTEGLIVREDNLIIDANQAAADLFGYDLEELRGMSFDKLVTPQTLEQIRQRVAAMRNAPESIQSVSGKKFDGPYEGVIVKKDGTTFPFEAIGRFMEYQGRQVRVMVLRDLRERKTAEEALRESEERFRVLEEASFEGILIHDSGRIIDANQTISDMFGYALDELAAMSFLDLVAPESRALVTQKLSETYAGFYEARGLRKDGSIFPFETQGRFTSYKGKQVKVKAIRDITERYQYENDLKDSEERWKFLSNSTTESIMVFHQAQIVDANQAALDLFGYTLEELKEIDISRMVTPETLREMMSRFQAGDPGNTGNESVIIHKNGELIPVEGRSRLTEYKGHEVRVAAFHDLREKKAAEALLKKTQAQLQQAQRMESIGLLAGGIAHDFNNLLTTIIGFGELASLHLEPGDPVNEDLQQILFASERAANLTHQLLAFSRQQLLQPKIVNLNERVAEMDKLLQRLIGEDIELVSLPDPALGLTMLDPSQFEQVIMNLAVNARDAMPHGGKLTIETANADLTNEYKSQHHAEIKEGSYVMLAVSDNGMGMSEEVMAKIFDPFYTTKEVGKGTGLGLATVYGIVNQSGGYIFVYSEPGIGTSFKIYLPRYVSDLDGKRTLPMATEEAAGKIHNLHGTETILVVEDDKSVRELILRSLQTYGYMTLEATNGEEALVVIGGYKDHIHMVLTDIVMPRLGGRELASEVEQRKLKIKMLCMSGYTDRVVGRHNILSNCHNFLQKPFTPLSLMAKVRETLDQP